MKKLLVSVLLVVSTLYFTTGCVSLSKMTPEQKATTIQQSSTDIAALGVSFLLAERPDARPVVVIFQQSLSRMLVNSNYSVIEFRSALTNLNVKEFRGTQGVLLVTGAIRFWSMTLGFIDLNESPLYAKAAITGVYQGTTEALNSFVNTTKPVSDVLTNRPVILLKP